MLKYEFKVMISQVPFKYIGSLDCNSYLYRILNLVLN